MIPSVRLIAPEDVALIVDLAADAARELRARRGGTFLVDAPGRITRDGESVLAVLDDDEALAILATVDEVPVGYAFAHIDRSLPGVEVMVDEVFTTAEARSVGVGERLLEEVTAWAIVHGATGVSALALPGDRDTKNFFEGMGMKARSITVHREL